MVTHKCCIQTSIVFCLQDINIGKELVQRGLAEWMKEEEQNTDSPKGLSPQVWLPLGALYNMTNTCTYK